MPPNDKVRDEIIAGLEGDIAASVGNIEGDELSAISTGFQSTINKALEKFNSTQFDDTGFIKKLQGVEFSDAGTKEAVNHILNNVRSDYVNAEALNKSELMMRRDLENIRIQMPEMRDAIAIIRDSIIECNVATGEVSRSLIFENTENQEGYESQVRSLEKKYKIFNAIKNFIVPKVLTGGEYYVQVTPYSKIFAEIDSINSKQKDGKGFGESVSMMTDENLTVLMESASNEANIDAKNHKKIDQADSKELTIDDPSDIRRRDLSALLESIDTYPKSSVIVAENGPEGVKALIKHDFMEQLRSLAEDDQEEDEVQAFLEDAGINLARAGSPDMLKSVNPDEIDDAAFRKIKGCYIKYLNPLQMIPVRLDRRVIGYYYVTSTIDIRGNNPHMNGIIDLSYQNYARDKTMVDQLASIIIRSFDKTWLNRNIKFKEEIADIIMAHRFEAGKLSFIYIPANEVCRFVVNEDEDGRGHSAIEPSIFPARNYLMLRMYNMLYTLNNTTTRVHYLRSSGLNKDYSSQIQRAIRKFTSRRITINDIYSYTNAMNKVGGIGEMVLPTGRGDSRAIDTDTIEAVNNPINMDFFDSQRREANSGTGIPHLMTINALDEADFAKTLELANARFISTVSSYKIDLNDQITLFYQMIMRADSDIPKEGINNFRFKFHSVEQQKLNITTEMIDAFNRYIGAIVEMYFTEEELKAPRGQYIMKNVKKEIAKEVLSQINFDEMDKVMENVIKNVNDDELHKRNGNQTITSDDIDEITG